MKPLVLIGFCLFVLFGFQRKSARMSWRDGHTLSWSDFQGLPSKGSAFSASSNTGISHRFTIKSTGIIDKSKSIIKANFYPKLSWYKPELIDEFTLKHEQTHFDISEVHARMFRKAVAEFRFTRNSKAEIQRIYKRIESSRRKMQSQFDAETEHSVNREAEKLWEVKVQALLHKYQPWAG